MYNILCYGDSNTYGHDPVTFVRLERWARWTGVLQKALGNEYYIIEEGLNGRTTVWEDPIEENKNGKEYLLPCLESHKPIDLVLIMLGTNDLKFRFSLTASDVACGMEVLINKVLNSNCGRNNISPKALLMAPAPITELSDELKEKFLNAKNKSIQLAGLYKKIAQKYGIDFLDVGEIVTTSLLDGLHLDKISHKRLGNTIAKKVELIIKNIS